MVSPLLAAQRGGAGGGLSFRSVSCNFILWTFWEWRPSSHTNTWTNEWNEKWIQSILRVTWRTIPKILTRKKQTKNTQYPVSPQRFCGCSEVSTILSWNLKHWDSFISSSLSKWKSFFPPPPPLPLPLSHMLTLWSRKRRWGLINLPQEMDAYVSFCLLNFSSSSLLLLEAAVLPSSPDLLPALCELNGGLQMGNHNWESELRTRKEEEGSLGVSVGNSNLA